MTSHPVGQEGHCFFSYLAESMLPKRPVLRMTVTIFLLVYPNSFYETLK